MKISVSRGSKKFYNFLFSSFSEKDFSSLTAKTFEFAWCFSEAGVKPGTVFEVLEKEILNKEKEYFSEIQVMSIKKSFQKIEKGIKELFEL